MGLTTEFQCVGYCKKKFGVGDWECAPGLKHDVEQRTFYILDAPALSEKDRMGKAFRDSRTTVLNVPPERVVKSDNGDLVRMPGGVVMFTRGMFATTDPEQIFWLEKHGYGNISKERWIEVYFSPLEKQQLKELELHNREREADRKVKEANDLLARVKEQLSTNPPKARSSV